MDTPHGGGVSRRLVLTSHTNVKIMWLTHSASLGSASVTPRLTARPKRGPPWGTRLSLRMQKLLLTIIAFFFARSCLGKVPGRTPFSQRSERVAACTFRMQINQQIDVQDELNKAKQNKVQITNYKLKRSAGRTRRREPTSTYTAEVLWGVYPKRGGEAECKSRRSRCVIECILVAR